MKIYWECTKENLNGWVNKKETGINRELFHKHFKFQRPSDILKVASTTNDENKNNKLVKLIKGGLIDLENETENMSKELKEKPNEIIDTVEKILEFNDRNQGGHGLKILTPSQMLSGLPISLAPLKAGNNSEKLKYEIRQLMYFLYRSKKLTKNIYKSLTDMI